MSLISISMLSSLSYLFSHNHQVRNFKEEEAKMKDKYYKEVERKEKKRECADHSR